MRDTDQLAMRLSRAVFDLSSERGVAMFVLSEKSKTNRIGVDQRLIRISDRAIQITPIDFGHGADSGLRTTKRQGELFASGVSKCDGVTHRGSHQDGEALDFTAYINGKPVWDHKYYAVLMVYVMQAANELGYKIKCGITFKPERIVDGVPYGWDGPHVELVD